MGRSIGLISAAVGLSALNAAGTVAAPAFLGDHSLAVAAASPRPLFWVMAVRANPVVVVAAVAMLRLFIADPINYSIGARAVHLARFERVRTSRAFARATRLVARFGLVAIVARPSGTVMTVAGAAGIPARRALLAAAAGTVIQVVGLFAAAGLHARLDQPAVRIAAVLGVVAAAALLVRHLSNHFRALPTIGVPA